MKNVRFNYFINTREKHNINEIVTPHIVIILREWKSKVIFLEKLYQTIDIIYVLVTNMFFCQRISYYAKRFIESKDHLFDVSCQSLECVSIRQSEEKSTCKKYSNAQVRVRLGKLSMICNEYVKMNQPF